MNTKKYYTKHITKPAWEDDLTIRAYKYKMEHTKYKLWIYLYKGQNPEKKSLFAKHKANINKECLWGGLEY